MALDLSLFERFAVTFQPGDVIFCEYEPGENFYLIQSGRVRIVKIFGDIEKTIDEMTAGEFFGEMALLEEAPRSATIIAIEKTKVLEFNKENFAILMQGNPQIALKLLKLFSKRIYDQKRRFNILKLEEPQAKVVEVFDMLSEDVHTGDDDQGKRVFYKSIEDIAHWAGISSDRCLSVLNAFVAQNKIELFQDKIIVKNINDLKRFVQSKRKES